MFNRNALRKLIRKYSGQGPRYTSYPTAVEFTPEFNSRAWSEYLKKEFVDSSGEQKSLSLYVHIPFCKSLCYFCACHKIIAKDRSAVVPYLRGLTQELESYRRIVPQNLEFEQIHLGGGSPSFFTGSETAELFQMIRSKFPISSENPDISIEVDPRTADPEKIAAYWDIGFRRISFGVQDIDPKVQETINRIQPLELTERMMDAARQAGFGSINIDLIYGLPEQTIESFTKTLDAVLKLRPERIALYGYAHVTWIKKVQKSFERATLPSPDERIELFLLALERLTDAGYLHIGMDHFALEDDSLSVALREGTLHRNFMGYSTHRGARQIALGVSGISCFPTGMAQSVKELDKYLELVGTGELPIERGLLRSADDMLRGAIIDQLFCGLAVDIPIIESRFQIPFWSMFSELQDALRAFEEDGLIELQEKAIKLTSVGRLFTRNVAMLFDAYLPGHLQGSKKVFSATV